MLRRVFLLVVLGVTSAFSFVSPDLDNVLEARQTLQNGPTTTAATAGPTVATPGAVSTSTSITQTSSGGTAIPTTFSSSTISNQTASAATNTLMSTILPTATNGTNATNGTSSLTANPLPIAPPMTPALAIGGVLLIIAGLALCFVGIKHNAVQIFISTTLLLTLAIEVLIIYVMNPPITDAVQGAYLVAGVIPGLIGGGVAIIFKEMSEGAGCFLGGFCFAMWLLCLAPGGLISDKVGRIVLLLVFAVVAWITNWSRYTRSYGIIVCTAFAGSSAFILGVDCLSRVGLKEFWMYIWDLNPNVFPLDTDTYPITRNLQAEQACVIVVAVLGVLTQFQIWKVIKAHRQKQDAERLQDEESRDVMESELGRNLEDRNRRERKVWENVYGDGDGDKSHDSGIGSSIGSPKTTNGISVKEKEVGERVNDHELSRTTTFASQEAYPMADLRPMSADGRSIVELIPSEPPMSPRTVWSSKSISKRISTASMRLRGLKPASTTQDRSATASQTAGSERAASTHAGDAAENDNDNADAFTIGSDDDDRASSIAATMAEEPDFGALSRPPSTACPSPAMPTSRFSMTDALSAALNEHSENFEAGADDDDEVVKKRPVSSLKVKNDDGSSIMTAEKEEKTTDKATTSFATLTADALPGSFSRAALSYRTNEWAKEAGRDAEPIVETDVPEAFPEESVRVDKEDAAARARAKENNAAKVKPVVVVPPKIELVAAQPRASLMSNSDGSSSKATSRPVSDAAQSPTQSTSDPTPSSLPPTRQQSMASTQDTQLLLSPETKPRVMSSASMISPDRAVPVDSPMAGQNVPPLALNRSSSQQLEVASPIRPRESMGTASPSPNKPMTNLLDVRNERIRSRIGTTSLTDVARESRIQSTSSAAGSLTRSSTTPVSDTAAPNSTLPIASAHASQTSDLNLLPSRSLSSLGQSPHTTVMQPGEFRSQSPEEMTLAERRALIIQSRPESALANENRSPSAMGMPRRLSGAISPPPAGGYRPPSSLATPLMRQTSASPLSGDYTRSSSSLALRQNTLSPPPQGTSSTPRARRSSQSLLSTSPITPSTIQPLTSPPHATRPVFDASKQASIRTQWLNSTSSGTPAAAAAQSTDAHLARMHALRQQVAAETRAREDAERSRQDHLDRAMRSGAGNHSHREALKRMQAKADVGSTNPSASAGSDGLFSPQAKGDLSAGRGRRSSSVKPPPQVLGGASAAGMRRGSSVTRWGANSPGLAGGIGTPAGIRRRDSDLNRGGWDGRTSRQA